MKTIGICTFSWANNYGALLQNYALENYLSRSFGNLHIKTVDYKCKNGFEIYDSHFKFPQITNFKSLALYPLFFLYRIILSNTKARIAARCDAFRKDELDLSQSFVDKTELIDYVKSLDCIITGSDQVLNSKIVEDDWDVYSLQLFKNIPKIGYAVSAGNSKYINKNVIRGGGA